MSSEVYHDPTERANWCWYCHNNEPDEGSRVFLCDAGHSPCNAEANYICEDHLDPDAVKFVYQVMLGSWKREEDNER